MMKIIHIEVGITDEFFELQSVDEIMPTFRKISNVKCQKVRIKRKRNNGPLTKYFIILGFEISNVKTYKM